MFNCRHVQAGFEVWILRFELPQAVREICSQRLHIQKDQTEIFILAYGNKQLISVKVRTEGIMSSIVQLMPLRGYFE